MIGDFLYRITEPALRPIRNFMPKSGRHRYLAGHPVPDHHFHSTRDRALHPAQRLLSAMASRVSSDPGRKCLMVSRSTCGSRGCHERENHRRQSHRRRAARQGHGRDAAADRGAWARSRTGGRSGRRRCREQNLCREQSARLARNRHAAVRSSIAGRYLRSRTIGARSPSSMPIPRCTAFWCNCRCRRRSMPRASSAAFDPDKDVDGFHPHQFRAARGETADTRSLHADCLHQACQLRRARHSTASMRSSSAVRNIVGNPLGQLLLAANATVTIAHTHTRDLPDLCRRAELLFVAIGRAEFIRGGWIKPGSTVIDVGINRVPGADGKSKIVGDVCFAEAVEVAGAITPVPGGVGPMTIVCLMVNTLRAACLQAQLPPAGVFLGFQLFQPNATLSSTRVPISPTTAPRLCRRARDRIPPRSRFPTAPTRSRTSSSSAPGRGALR